MTSVKTAENKPVKTSDTEGSNNNYSLLSIDMKTKVVQHVPRIKLDNVTT